MNKSIDCPSYEGCDAAICPLDEDSMRDCPWYPDEEVCRSRKFSQLKWLNTQKKITRLKLGPDYFFTKRMLNSIERVTKSLKGADPDKPNAEARWFRKRERIHRKPARMPLFV